MWQFWGLKVLRRRIFALFAILLLLASVPNIYKVNSQQLEYRLITFSDLVLIIFKKAIF